MPTRKVAYARSAKRTLVDPIAFEDRLPGKNHRLNQ